MAAWPAPDATAKMVSAFMPPYVTPTPRERNAMAAAENLLRHETSPYLLQHADNPVHWRPWGAAALEEARAANKPILLSIGYAACHWCHVMAHESFEDPDTAGADERAVRQHQGRPRGTARTSTTSTCRRCTRWASRAAGR